MSRRTIAGETEIAGIGLHLGQPCRLVFKPAPTGSGIVFRRVDLPGAPLIPARVEFASKLSAAPSWEPARRRSTRSSTCSPPWAA